MLDKNYKIIYFYNAIGKCYSFCGLPNIVRPGRHLTCLGFFIVYNHFIKRQQFPD